MKFSRIVKGGTKKKIKKNDAERRNSVFPEE